MTYLDKVLMSKVSPLMNLMLFLGVCYSYTNKKILPTINVTPQRRVMHTLNEKKIRYLHHSKKVDTDTLKKIIFKNTKRYILKSVFNPSLIAHKTKSSVRNDYSFTRTTNTPRTIHTSRNSLLKPNSKLHNSYCSPYKQSGDVMTLSDKSSNRNLPKSNPWYKPRTTKSIEHKNKLLPLVKRGTNKERNKASISIRKYSFVNARRRAI
jgi:hypothetical protein